MTDDRPQRRKLNDETVTYFREAIGAGLTIERTCHHYGINDSTWRRWRQQGEADLDEGTPETLEARLCTAVQEARLTAERRAVLALVRAAVGDEQTVTRTTETERWLRVKNTETGEWEYQRFVERSTITETRTVRDWRAALAWLERTQPHDYARVTRQWVSGPDEGPLEFQSVDAMREQVLAGLEELEAELAAANDREEHLAIEAGVVEPEATDDT